MKWHRRYVVSQPMPREIAEQLQALELQLTDVMTQLAEALWQRSDAGAVDLSATRILDRRKWFSRRGERYTLPIRRDYLRAAVRSVLEVGRPPVGATRELA